MSKPTASLWAMRASRDPTLDKIRVRALTTREIARIKHDVAAMRKRDEKQLAPFRIQPRGFCPWCGGRCD